MKIAHFKTGDSSFVLKDQEILERHFEVHNHRIRNDSVPAYVLALLKLLGFMLVSGWRYEAYFVRFADWHTAILAFFRQLYRKKLFVVIGGFDVAAIPQLGYGAHLVKSRSRCIKYTLDHATCLLPNSNSMVRYENNFIPGGPVSGGIRHFMARPGADIQVVYNGFDHQKFRHLPGVVKRPLALTVALIDRERTFHLKGIGPFIETARRLPGYDFLIVGIRAGLLQEMKIHIPKNLHTLDFAGQEELIRLYSEARVYCTFSISEGMPNALCEAMLCECIPVGTRVTSIPEIIGDCGFVVDEPETERYVTKVEEAFGAGPEAGKAARERIEKH